ncbi:hypothetical protein [Mesorhizobium sp. M0037]|uniref:hypothetical protein n=1 Tax=unclassified Mesorhizobium TaxID=325217 RepID=UPI003338C03E
MSKKPEAFSSNRFIWEAGDLISVGEETQPFDTPSSSFEHGRKPPLPEGKMPAPKLEAAVRDLAEWLRQEADRQLDEALIPEFQAGQKSAAEIDDGLVQAAIDGLPTIYEDEKAAILDGNANRLRGEPDPWRGMIRCLRTGAATAEFLRALAVLMEANVLHQRATATKTSIEQALRDRALVYTAIIERAYSPKPNQSERWAKAVIVHEERRIGESPEQATTRVYNDLGRFDLKAAKRKASIDAAIERLRSCRVVPRP